MADNRLSANNIAIDFRSACTNCVRSLSAQNAFHSDRDYQLQWKWQKNLFYVEKSRFFPIFSRFRLSFDAFG